MTKPSAFIVRRARLILGLTQAGFAERYNVDDSTVSRWERGVMEPSPAVLAKIHEVARGSNHVPRHELVRASPVFRFLAPMDRLTEPLIISRGAVRLLGGKVGLDPEEYLSLTEELGEYYAQPGDPDYTYSFSRALTIVQEDPRWLKLEIAYAEMHAYGRLFRAWGFGLVAPVPDEGLALYEAAIDTDPEANKKGFWVRPTLVHDL
jgi:transcriptional regulator with XRE-family HTH domain